MPKKTDFYSRLNIHTGASEDAIKRAYRMAVKQAHPDVNKQTGATELFLGIQEAYQVLSHPQKREDYDQGREPRSSESDVHLTVQYSSENLFHYQEPQVIYSLIDVVSPEEDKDLSNLPLNIALVLDTSTSMKGKRLEILKAATKEIIHDLDPDDAVSVVSFNDRARVLLANQTNPQPLKVESSINTLFAEGGTEIFQGLEAAFEEINKKPTDSYISHIVLITDGHTYGDEDNCFTLAKTAATMDIGLSSLGIGVEWNDEFVDELCALTGGESKFIENPSQVKDFLKESIFSLKEASARQISLFMQPAPGVERLSSFRILPEVLPLPAEEEIPLGVMKKDQHHRVLFEFFIQPVPQKIDRVVIANGEFILKRKPRDFSLPFTLERPLIEPVDTPSSPPEEIFQAISHLAFYRLQEKAQRDIVQGNPGAAYQRLLNLSSHLMAKGQNDLAKIAMKEAEYIKSHHTFSPDGKKQLKYGTRRLLLPG